MIQRSLLPATVVLGAGDLAQLGEGCCDVVNPILSDSY